jgi:hypothetical protein
VKQLGIFGNAKINYEKDWLSLLSDNIDGITTPSDKNGVWDSEAVTCTHVAGMEL